MKSRNIMSALAFAASCVCLGSAAHAGVSFDLVDLADNPGAPNRMTLIYHLGDALAAGAGLNLIFDARLFADLDPLTPASGDWFAYAAQPVPAVPLDGVASFLALNSVAAHGQLEVTFTWLGAGMPGTQPYELVDDQFNVVVGGHTTPTSPVPEPPTALMLLLGAALVALRHRSGQRAA